MTKFANKSFTVPMGVSDAYRRNWERTFGKAEPPRCTESGLLCVDRAEVLGPDLPCPCTACAEWRTGRAAK